MKRILFILLSFMALSINFVMPAVAVASTKVAVSQVILPPSCYDYVSTFGGTTDYIATFDCEYRRPDGTVLEM